MLVADLDGDGRDEGVVALTWECGDLELCGNSSGGLFGVFASTEAGLALIDGRPHVVTDLQVADGLLAVERWVWLDDDSRCCPSAKSRRLYELREGELRPLGPPVTWLEGEIPRR